MKTRPEILAPAGSMESLTAAINCGADAVYLGSKSLNARRNAGNFDYGELCEAVAEAHLHGAKILQTLNIVMFDNELDELLKAAMNIAAIGVDAVIVQDLGVLSLLKRAVPSLKLFSSTQMAVHNLSGALQAEALGCSRIVLARELSSSEIRHIRENVKAQIEVFVHGALCMSVSGQCYLSSMIGGRSGNRGLCAQPCRLPFNCGEREYALSLKDLSLVERVDELCEIGVNSLKIEGRMKRPEYVAAAVTALRQALDGQAPNLEQLRAVFSRSGFTSGYFDGKRDIFMFGARQKDDVTAASSVLSELALLASRDIGPVPLFGAFTAEEGEPISLAVKDSDGNCAFFEGDAPQIARSKPTDEERVRQSLMKTGGTAFHFEDLDIELGENLMIPVSQLNELRRRCLEQLVATRKAPRPLDFIPQSKDNENHAAAFAKQKIRSRLSSLSQLSEKLISHSDELLLPLFELQSCKSLPCPAEKIIAEIPRMLFTEQEKTAAALKSVKAAGITRAWCGNIGALRLAREAGLLPEAGWSLNLTNRYALNTVRELQTDSAELSFELSLPQAKALCGAVRETGILAYGFLPLMYFRSCPVRDKSGCDGCLRDRTLTDRKGISFAVKCPEHLKMRGESELFNYLPLYLADRINELSDFAFLTLWFTREDAKACADIAAQYKGTEKPLLPQDYTRGLYYRSVI